MRGSSTVVVVCLLFALGYQTAFCSDIAIVDVTVVDVADGALHANRTVLVRDGKVAQVDFNGDVDVPDGADVVEASGGYLVPGLWDAHVHSAGSWNWHFPLLLAYGITSVCNMHSASEKPLERVNSIKRRLASGEILGPRFIANGGVMDGDPPVWPGSVVVRNAEEARSAVDEMAAGGADFIKIYNNLSRESYFAILKRAKERGIPVDGHVPIWITPEEAAAAGQRTIEHTIGMNMGCSSEAATIRSDFARYVEERATMPAYPDGMVAYFKLVRRSIDTRDASLCEKTVRAYREHGVTSVPTLVSNAGSNGKAFINDASRLSLLPMQIRRQWAQIAQEGDDPIEVLLGPVEEAFADYVRLLNEGHVTLLAGTDVGNPFLVPGLSLHRELQLLNRAGLSPLQSLQAATIEPARVFGLADSLGTIEVGKLADLLLLDASPLENIANTQRIRAVVVAGKLLRRRDLDQLLTEVRTAVP